MKNIFFAADYHFGHEGPYRKFTKDDGSFLRAPFYCAEECDEEMVKRHNEVVKPNDRVYIVGDVTFHKKYLPILDRMNGKKVLIKGNHDTLDAEDYLAYFDDIRGVHQFDGILISHIPVHEQSLGRWGFNVHGHLHAQRVLLNNRSIDQRYFCVSVEQINYTPISLEQVKKHKP